MIEPFATRAVRFLTATAFGMHTVACLGWWWISPGGFPYGYLRFWANALVALLFAAAAAFGAWACHARRDALARGLAGTFAVAWLVGSVCARVVFPISFSRKWLLGLACAVLWLGLAWLLPKSRRPFAALRMSWPLAIGGAVVMTLAQRSPSALTRPLNVEWEPHGAEIDRRSWPLQFSPQDWLTVSAGGMSAVAQWDRYRIQIRPFLQFFSTSPDRCWTILRPRTLPEPGTDQRLIAMGGGGTESGDALWCRYSDGSALRCGRIGAADQIVQFDTNNSVPQDVFSHLNAFSELTVTGHERLFLTFSPCPDDRIEVLPADYPVGLPLRFGCFYNDGRFVVHEASSGEKGPFRELASGPLLRNDRLTVTLWDHSRAFCRITWIDWAAQADTSLSPTAGWGVPLNAIEFQLEPDGDVEPIAARRAAARISITLAGTSVGRGWDSVGHRAGNYRNRLQIEVLRDVPTPQQSE